MSLVTGIVFFFQDPRQKFFVVGVDRFDPRIPQIFYIVVRRAIDVTDPTRTISKNERAYKLIRRDLRQIYRESKSSIHHRFINRFQDRMYLVEYRIVWPKKGHELICIYT